MAASKDNRVKELQDKCGLSAKECRTTLEESGGDVDAALAALIDAGKVKSEQLNPQTVSEALFARAARREKVAMYEQLTDPTKGVLGMFAKTMKLSGESAKIQKQASEAMAQLMNEQFGGKSAAEIVAEKEADQAKTMKKRGIKPISEGESARIWAKVTQRSAKLKKKPKTLKLKPFPPLKMGLSNWEGKDVLEAWKGTQQRHGPYTSLSGKGPSKGTVMVEIPRLGEDDANPRPPAKEQVAAYAHLKENQLKVTHAIMAGLLDYYTKLRKEWLKHDPNLELPEINTTDEMRKNVGLGTLHMHNIAKKGFAYIGLEMGCTWDDEHGAGVLLHKDRVVEVGQADTSFLEWIATGDGGKDLK